MSSGLRSSVQKRNEGRVALVMIGTSACRSFDTEPSRTRICHALAQLLARLRGGGRLMVGADAGGEIAVEVAARAAAAHGRRYGRPGRPRAWRGRPGRRETPGKFMNSARPMTLGWFAKGRRSAASSRRRRSPDGSPARSSRAARAVHDGLGEQSRKYRMPSAPSTLAISCGSQIAVVTPWRSTQRSNSSRRHQRGFDVQMRVDEARNDDRPRASISRAPL